MIYDGRMGGGEDGTSGGYEVGRKEDGRVEGWEAGRRGGLANSKFALSPFLPSTINYCTISILIYHLAQYFFAVNFVNKAACKSCGRRNQNPF